MRITVVISGRNVTMHTRFYPLTYLWHTISGVAYTLRPSIKRIKAILKDLGRNDLPG